MNLFSILRVSLSYLISAFFSLTIHFYLLTKQRYQIWN